MFCAAAASEGQRNRPIHSRLTSEICSQDLMATDGGAGFPKEIEYRNHGPKGLISS